LFVKEKKRKEKKKKEKEKTGTETGKRKGEKERSILGAQSKENKSTSFEITGGADLVLLGGSKIACLRKPRSGSRVTSDMAFSLNLSPATSGWLLFWATTGAGEENVGAVASAGAKTGAGVMTRVGAGVDDVKVEKKSSSNPCEKEKKRRKKEKRKKKRHVEKSAPKIEIDWQNYSPLT